MVDISPVAGADLNLIFFPVDVGCHFDGFLFALALVCDVAFAVLPLCDRAYIECHVVLLSSADL